MNRPGLQDMIKDCENGRLDMVLVYKLDRLSRSQKDTLYLIEDVFEKNGVGFTSITENFDTSTPHGKFIVGILSVFAQLEREKIKERTMLGKDSRAKEGKWHGGALAPIGYDYVDGTLVKNEYEAMQIKEIADLFLQGTPIRTLESICANKGYRHKHGEWNTTTIRRVLSNPLYIGMIKNKDKFHTGIHEPILDQATFDAIQILLQERRDQFAATRPYQSLLGGIVFCKNCGARYSRQIVNRKHWTYMCYSRSKKTKSLIKDPTCRNKNYRMEVLEAAILEEIKKLVVDPNRIEEIKKNRPVNDAADKAKFITSEIEKINTQLSKLMDLYALGGIDFNTISEKVSGLNNTKMALTEELNSLDVPKAEKVMSEEEIRGVAALMQDDLPLDDKRGIVQSLIRYIEIDEEDIIIHWKF